MFVWPVELEAGKRFHSEMEGFVSYVPVLPGPSELREAARAFATRLLVLLEASLICLTGVSHFKLKRLTL